MTKQRVNLGEIKIVMQMYRFMLLSTSAENGAKEAKKLNVAQDANGFYEISATIKELKKLGYITAAAVCKGASNYKAQIVTINHVTDLLTGECAIQFGFSFSSGESLRKFKETLK